MITCFNIWLNSLNDKWNIGISFALLRNVLLWSIFCLLKIDFQTAKTMSKRIIEPLSAPHRRCRRRYHFACLVRPLFRLCLYLTNKLSTSVGESIERPPMAKYEKSGIGGGGGVDEEEDGGEERQWMKRGRNTPANNFFSIQNFFACFMLFSISFSNRMRIILFVFNVEWRVDFICFDQAMSTGDGQPLPVGSHGPTDGRVRSEGEVGWGGGLTDPVAQMQSQLDRRHHLTPESSIAVVVKWSYFVMPLLYLSSQRTTKSSKLTPKPVTQWHDSFPGTIKWQQMNGTLDRIEQPIMSLL